MDEYERLGGEESEEVVNPQEADDAAEDAEGAESSENPEQSRQTQADNHRYQAARHAGEQAGYEKAMREVNEKIRRTGMRNPISGEEISDIEGLDAYGKAYRRQRIETRAKETGRSVEEVQEEEDNRDFLRDARRRDAEEKKAQAEKTRQQQWIAADAAAFLEAYPDVDLNKLDGDAAFRRFCGSRYGKEPLADLYEDYLEIAGGAERAGALKAGSKSARATGTGGGSGAETLTAAQQRELDEWNRENPRMRMSAKEFLSR